jgi:hypothetical protein
MNREGRHMKGSFIKKNRFTFFLKKRGNYRTKIFINYHFHSLTDDPHDEADYAL